jgi:hypothetical protein
MGFFKSIKKAFKKITKGVSKVIKKGVKAVKKVVKKISSSKILRTLAIAAAVVVTGGAALGAFPGLASTQIGSAIVNAGTWVSNLPVVGTLTKPFQAMGSFAGETLYSAGARAGLIKDVDMAAKTLEAAGQGTFTSIKEAIGSGLTTESEVISKASAFVADGASAIATAPTLTPTELSEIGSKELLPSSIAKTVGSAAGSLVAPAVGFGKEIAKGYTMGKILGPDEQDPRGSAGFGAEEERQSQMDALQVVYNNTGIDISDAYANMSFGTGDVGYLSNIPKGPDPLAI